MTNIWLEDSTGSPFFIEAKDGATAFYGEDGEHIFDVKVELPTEEHAVAFMNIFNIGWTRGVVHGQWLKARALRRELMLDPA